MANNNCSLQWLLYLSPFGRNTGRQMPTHFVFTKTPSKRFSKKSEVTNGSTYRHMTDVIRRGPTRAIQEKIDENIGGWKKIWRTPPDAHPRSFHQNGRKWLVQEGPIHKKSTTRKSPFCTFHVISSIFRHGNFFTFFDPFTGILCSVR